MRAAPVRASRSSSTSCSSRVDLKKIKDLQQLLALLQEVEDYAAANEDGEPGDDEDAAPAPA